MGNESRSVRVLTNRFHGESLKIAAADVRKIAAADERKIAAVDVRKIAAADVRKPIIQFTVFARSMPVVAYNYKEDIQPHVLQVLLKAAMVYFG